jgi:hypothetical protein
MLHELFSREKYFVFATRLPKDISENGVETVGETDIHV